MSLNSAWKVVSDLRDLIILNEVAEILEGENMDEWLIGLASIAKVLFKNINLNPIHIRRASAEFELKLSKL